jgi:hypothetical protein
MAQMFAMSYFWVAAKRIAMSQVYRMSAESKSQKLVEFQCKNEDRDLQLLLENQLELLPGDQIKGDETEDLRWILVKREMPVVNAASGEPALSIDFLLADQYGIPTLVECKRHQDGRTRREVVAQMLEYAANGHYYWSESELFGYALESAGGEQNLRSKVCELKGFASSPEEFFRIVSERLRDRKIRCIFFVEKSPKELTSLVDFVNGQMKDVELLIVEARQYELEPGGDRIIVPRVFGFTEEARAAKRESKAETLRSKGATGEDAFWEAAASNLGDFASDGIQRLRSVIEALTKISGCETKWAGSWMLEIPSVVPQRTLFAIRKNGELELYLERWKPREGNNLDQLQQEAYNTFISGIGPITQTTKEGLEGRSWPRINAKQWLSNSDRLVDLVNRIAAFASVPV